MPDVMKSTAEFSLTRWNLSPKLNALKILGYLVLLQNYVLELILNLERKITNNLSSYLLHNKAKKNMILGMHRCANCLLY